MRGTFFVGTFLAIAGLSSAAQATDRWFFASDVHDYGDNLKSILQSKVKNQTYSAVALVGDYQKNFEATKSYYNTIKGIVDGNKPSNAVTIMSEGNHDMNCSGCFTHATGGYEMVDLNNVAFTDSDLFVINARDFCNDDTSMRLGSYLLAHWTGETVVVLGHYPLHSTRFRDQQYPSNWQDCEREAREIFQTLQIAVVADGRDVVYVWGHNHSEAKWDQGVDYVMVPGEVMPTGQYIDDPIEGQEVHFLYLNAGYIKPRTGETPATSHWSKVSIDSDEVRVYRDGSSSATTVPRPFWQY